MNSVMKHLESDEYYMANVFLAAKRSKDPVAKVGGCQGACIVNDDKKIVGIGYNGFPTGCNDTDFPWTKNADDPIQSKYLYVCHAEVNAILYKSSASVKGCHIYVALFPCNGCAKMIIESQIQKVIYYSDKHANKPTTIASKKLLDAAGVEYVKFNQFELYEEPLLLFHNPNEEEYNDVSDHLSWTDYFMAMAILAAYRGRDPINYQGACISSPENKIVGIGYNTLPINCNYNDFSHSTDADKDLYFCHAEMHAIANKICESVKNCSMYMLKFPCCECTKIIIQSGIRNIYYLDEENFDSVESIAACRMFDAVGIKYYQYEMVTSKILIDFSVINRKKITF